MARQNAAALHAPMPVARSGVRLLENTVPKGVSMALPPEYAALEITKFEPWAALDSLAFANLFLLGQFFDDSDAGRTQTLLTYQGTGVAAGFDGTKLFFEDLARFEPFDHTTTLPAASVRAGRTSEALVAQYQETYGAGVEASDFRKRIVPDLVKHGLTPHGRKGYAFPEGCPARIEAERRR